MRCQSSGSCVSVSGLPASLFDRKRSAMRQSAFNRGRNPAPKRKLERDEDEEERAQSRVAEPVARVPTLGDLGKRRTVVDQLGNRVVVDGLKRLRVCSPPSASSPATATTPPSRMDAGMDDIAMEEEEDDNKDKETAIIPAARSSPTVGTLSPVAKQFYAQAFVDAVVSDPSSRALIVFNPNLPTIERMPRIELVESDDRSSSQDSDESESESFVRFEELPDDYEESEDMELD